MFKRNLKEIQANQYDKIFRENMEAAFPAGSRSRLNPNPSQRPADVTKQSSAGFQDWPSLARVSARDKEAEALVPR